MNNVLFQSAIFAFIGFSFLLIIVIPVIFSSPEVWKKSKTKITLFSGIGVWFLLIFFIGIFNSFVV